MLFKGFSRERLIDLLISKVVNSFLLFYQEIVKITYLSNSMAAPTSCWLLKLVAIVILLAFYISDFWSEKKKETVIYTFI